MDISRILSLYLLPLIVVDGRVADIRRIDACCLRLRHNLFHAESRQFGPSVVLGCRLEVWLLLQHLVNRCCYDLVTNVLPLLHDRCRDEECKDNHES